MATGAPTSLLPPGLLRRSPSCSTRAAGLLSPPSTTTAATSPSVLAVADVNGDAQPDLVVANFGETVSVLLNQGAGVFAAPVSYDAGQSPESVAAADLNGDNAPDIVATNSSSNDVSVLLNHGNGSFDDAVGYAAGDNPGPVAIADFDADGALDLVVGSEGNVRVLFNSGDATFAPVDHAVIGYAQGVAGRWTSMVTGTLILRQLVAATSLS